MATCALATSLGLFAAVTTRAAVGERARGVERRGNIDHLYRVIGKVRLLFFWVGADDVGGARIAWRGDERDHAVSLLIGSEPSRAPRAVNEWGYIREQLAGDTATVFGIRTVTDGDSPDEAESRRTRADGQVEFGVLCSTITPSDARTRTAAVFTPPGATYRDAHRVLDVVERQARWKWQRTPRPVDVAPGFLTALDLLMRTSVVSPRGGSGAPNELRRAYIYKDGVYDLIPRSIQPVPELRLRSGLFRNLLRAEILVKKRATGSTTPFWITYGTEGALAGVPVAARFQPNWWFKAELELDGDGDTPPDPANDVSISQRIASLCAHR